jgi:hypothetical protein
MCDSCVADDFVFALFHFVMILSSPFGCDPVGSESLVCRVYMFVSVGTCV